ncbi:MAG TPA: alpha-glucan family phosphorylase [Desulfomonilaceae bacterium]|nr:alpha-glucan family phosphorylase [Desulfomonilaceae bacterium]
MKMRRLIVKPDLPEELQGLRNIAMNLWFSWNPEVNRLFQGLDPDLWEECGHNPVLLLANLTDTRKAEIVQDYGLKDRIQQVERSFEDYIGGSGSYSFNLERPIDYRIAYFSMEFGLSECLPVYSGGLGLLAGDHLKSASNLFFPLIGMGLLYQKGYFKQYLNIDGWQQESYPDNDFYNLPVSPVMDATGRQATLDLNLDAEKVKILVWKIQVGRIPLYLLDSNHPENSDSARRVTAELYGGDTEMRIKQEIVLGIGGARAFHLLGLWPFVYHLNEGHAAFAALERIRQAMITYRVPFDVALESVAASTVFTTHTPVPAGIDRFPPDLVERYFRGYVDSVGLTVKDLLDLGRENPDDKSSPLSMAVLALRLSRGVNGVSRLHGQVSKKMWRNLWPHVDEEDIPIGYVTNGVHIPSYVSKEMADLFERYLGEGWIEEPDNTKIWSRVYHIPHEQLWRVHETRRERLVVFCRRRFWTQMRSTEGFDSGASVGIRRAFEVLSPEALTIGFARRFAPYKRAGLLFTDPDRLLRIISDKRRPVQFIFAGKAHPQDLAGKELIKKVVHQSRSEGFRRKLVFIEDYDINIARYLVQGVDVWLNTPRRPYEACGTSGMKAAANGALNLSILDGWWPEAYNGSNGWAIGSGEEFEDPDYQDKVDSTALYELLENEVVPRFFDRGPDGLPHAWIDMIKNSMATICVRFNSHRMIEDYMNDYYIQAGLAHQVLGETRLSRARELRDWKQKVRSQWKDVKILEVSLPQGDRVALGDELEVNATIQLGGLRDEEVIVDLTHGLIGQDGNQLAGRDITAMRSSGKVAEGVWRFTGTIPCDETGVYGYGIRVLPFHPYLFSPLSMNLLTLG